MYYDHHNIPLSKALRKNMTPWERKLWFCFLKTYEYRFQRQKCIDGFIVDFYCAKAKLIIELDGGGHYNETATKKDCIRDCNLENHGLKILHFCNLDIDRNFYEVCSVIDDEVKKRILSDT